MIFGRESGEDRTKDPDQVRTRYGFVLVITGIILVGVMYALTLWAYRGGQAAEVATAMGAVTTVVGTLVGAFFGVQLGAAGREKIEDRAENARRKADALASAALSRMDPDEAPKVFEAASELLGEPESPSQTSS